MGISVMPRQDDAAIGEASLAQQLRYVPRETFRFLRQLPQFIATRCTPIRRGERHSLPGPLVVSLTSHPPRFGTLGLTLRSLLSQDVRPDALVLWLANSERRLLPAAVTSLERFGLLIRQCDDLRSYKKIMPAVAAYPDAFIVTADDDIRYPRGWLRRFVEEYRRSDEILCQRGRRILIGDDGRLAPYWNWAIMQRACDAGPGVFPTGVGG